MGKQRIKRKTATLFVESEISKENIWIRNLLINNHQFPHLKGKEYDNLEDGKKRYLDSRFGELLEYAISEWGVLFDNQEKETEEILNCELCGENDIKILSKIKNSKNEKELLVGSSCINDYLQMKDTQGNTLYQIRKESNSETNRILKNEEILENRSPNILKDIEKYNVLLNNSSLMIRSDLRRKYELLSLEVVNKYRKYLKLKNMKEDKILEIITIHNNIKSFFKDFDNYIDESDKDIYGLNKDVSRWCLYNQDYGLISKLENKGKIDKETISFIKEPKFLRKIIPMFETILNEKGLSLINKNNIGLDFRVEFDVRKGIYIDINSLTFIDEYKDYLFDNVTINVDVLSLINSGKISEDKSLNNALSYICRDGFNNLNYIIKFSDKEINELTFYNKVNKTFYVIDFIKFVNNFIKYIFESKINNDNVEVLEKYINNKSEKYNYSDYEEHLKNYGIRLKDIF